jgi:hypothetical protein
MTTIRPIDIYEAFFEQQEDGTQMCRYCGGKKRYFKFSVRNGYSNAKTHALSTHTKDWEAIVMNYLDTKPKEKKIKDYCTRPVSQSRSVTDRARSIHGWMNIIVMEDNPFTIVESENYQLFTHHMSISRPTIMKYLHAAHMHADNPHPCP